MWFLLFYFGDCVFSNYANNYQSRDFSLPVIRFWLFFLLGQVDVWPTLFLCFMSGPISEMFDLGVCFTSWFTKKRLFVFQFCQSGFYLDSNKFNNFEPITCPMKLLRNILPISPISLPIAAVYQLFMSLQSPSTAPQAHSYWSFSRRVKSRNWR